MQYSVVDKRTGKVLRTGSCPKRDYFAQARELDEAVVPLPLNGDEVDVRIVGHEPTLEEVRIEALALVNATMAARRADIEKERRLNFDMRETKRLESLAVLDRVADPALPQIQTPFIEREAKLRGISLQEMAELVVAKSEEPLRVLVDLEIERQRLQLGVRRAQSIEAVAGVVAVLRETNR